MTDLKHVRNQLHNALNEKDAAQEALQTAMGAYETLLKEFEAQHPDIVKKRDNALKRYEQATRVVNTLHSTAQTAMEEKFIDDLPEGLYQDYKRSVIYDAQSLRIQALQHFHHLLVLDEAAVEKFFTCSADEHVDGSLTLPETIRSLASVEVVFKPDVDIDMDAIQKLVIADTQDLSLFAAALGEDDESPADDCDNSSDVVLMPDVNLYGNNKV